MNLTTVRQFVTSKTGRQMLKLQKQSPHILFGAGVVGVVATAVTASVATLKVDDVLADHETQMAKIKRAVETAEIDYSIKDAQRDTYLQYSKTILRTFRLYAPTILLGTLSIGALAGSHRILTVRNVALSAAFSSMETAFDQYRQRVVQELGPDKDREFRFASERLEVMEETKRGPQPKDLVRVDKDQSPYLYAKLFDSTNKNWERKPEYNVMFLRSTQQQLNDQLRSRGHLFLNEAYDALGLDRTPTGAVCGWVWQGNGDSFVDFGIWDPDREGQFFDFVTGREGAILLDFNVDGDIWNKI